jgi:hypothetical protein
MNMHLGVRGVLLATVFVADVSLMVCPACIALLVVLGAFG